MPRKTARKHLTAPPRGSSGDYAKNWTKWVIIYLLVGGLIYLAIYAFFFQQGTYTDYSSTTQNLTYP